MLGAGTLLAFGLLPRTTAPVAWIGFLFVQMFEFIGPIVGVEFRLVEILIPYWHLPRILAGGDFTAAPLLVLTIVGATVGLAGLIGWRPASARIAGRFLADASAVLAHTS